MSNVLLEVLIENLTFPEQEVKFILIQRNGNIQIDLEDYAQGRNYKQYDKWINICGTLQNSIIEQLNIGKHHFDEKFHFHCSWVNGLPEGPISEISIRLKMIKGENAC